MCGIAGLWSPETIESETLELRARHMAGAIGHRGPDAEDTWIDARCSFAVAHRRLSIIDVSPNGAQPMDSACGRFVLSFNGEIYNFASLKRDLEAAGQAPAWRGRSDTEVLLAAIAAWGVERTLRAVDGMFAFALWDRERRTLTLARDRFGEKPLLYGYADEGLVFASELHAIRAVADFSAADFDKASIAAFLATGTIPAPRSIFASIRKLEPGSQVVFTADDVHERRMPPPRRYWSAREAARQAADMPFDGGFDDAVEELGRLLERTVRSRLMADVPLGAMLSGGVDSGLVAAFAQASSGATVKTFSVGFDDTGYDEAARAAELATAIGSEHTTIRVGERDALELAPSIAGIYDEPFADSSQLPTLLVSRALHRHVTVALSGDGGDELFGGYVRHRAGPRLWRTLSRLPRSFRRVAGLARDRLGSARTARLLAAATGARGERVERIVKALDVIDAEDPAAVYARLRRLASSTSPLAAARYGSAGDLDTPLPDVRVADLSRAFMLRDTTGYLPDDILTKVDRASMSTSLEVRPPFLGPELFRFAWSLPTSWLVSEHATKRILRALASKRLPAIDWQRPKQGFAIPLDDWLRGPLSGWAGDMLSDIKRDPPIPLDFDVIDQLWNEHRSKRANHGQRLWPLLMLESWRENSAPQRPSSTFS